MMRLIEEKEESKKKIIMSVVVVLSTFLPAFVLVAIASGNVAMSLKCPECGQKNFCKRRLTK